MLRSKGEYNPTATPFLYSWTITASYTNGINVMIQQNLDVPGKNIISFLIPNDWVHSDFGPMVMSSLVIELQVKTGAGVALPARLQSFWMQ